MTFEAIVFDFDGVIVESVDVKTRAFEQLFAAHPGHLEEIRLLHLENTGVSRFEKFRRIHESILGKPIGEAELASLGRRFSDLVVDEVVECPYVAGAQRLLDVWKRRCALYVASGTPEPELRAIVRRRGLDDTFTGVFGTPSTKRDILGRILGELRIEPRALLFVGDAEADWEAARAVGVPFVARRRPDALDRFPSKGPIAHVADLSELEELLEVGAFATSES